jgi:hypothetical protein
MQESSSFLFQPMKVERAGMPALTGCFPSPLWGRGGSGKGVIEAATKPIQITIHAGSLAMRRYYRN